MRNLVGGLIVIASILLGLYVGIIWCIVQPICQIGDAISNNTLTFWLVFWEVLKFIFRGFLSGIVIYLGVFVGCLIVSEK